MGSGERAAGRPGPDRVMGQQAWRRDVASDNAGCAHKLHGGSAASDLLLTFGARRGKAWSEDLMLCGTARHVRTDTDGHGRTCTDTYGHRQTRKDVDGHRRTHTDRYIQTHMDTDGHRRTRKDADGHGRTHTDRYIRTHGHRRTQTGTYGHILKMSLFTLILSPSPRAP